MSDLPPNAEPMAPVPAPPAPAAAPAPKRVDVDNVLAFVVAAGMALAIMYFKPDGPALAEASAVIGASLLYIQRSAK